MDMKKAAAWFIIILMVLSIGGVIGGTLLNPDGSNSLTQEFNGFTFKRENNVWTTLINGQKYGFLYLPQEVQALSLPVSVASWKSAEKVYFVDKSVAQPVEPSAAQSAASDNTSVGASSFSASPPSTFSLASSSLPLLQAVFYTNNVRLQEACFSEKECVKDVPIVSCEKPVLIIKEAEKNALETTLKSDEQCLVVEAISASEVEKVTERIIYEFLGVLP